MGHLMTSLKSAINASDGGGGKTTATVLLADLETSELVLVTDASLRSLLLVEGVNEEEADTLVEVLVDSNILFAVKNNQEIEKMTVTVVD